MTRIVLYTDKPVLAIGLEAALAAAAPDWLLVVVDSINALEQSIREDTPAVVLLDQARGLSCVLLAECSWIRNLGTALWVEDISAEFAFQAINLGVRGLIPKQLPAPALISCLVEIAAGGRWFDKNLADRILCEQRVFITPREGELVNLVAQGMKNKEIAATLHITEGTVKVYLSRLFMKLSVKDRLELAIYGRKNLTGDGLACPRGKSLVHLRTMAMERELGRLKLGASQTLGLRA